ncbi:hypothetical protein DOABOMFO_00062 [Enterococcus phage EF_KTM]|nr:hypothetical protein DDLHHHOO_00037 [Enterococcus phage EF_RCK]WVH07324.1 hypothetical protein AIMFIBHH_00034 [Enterococcus phage EF_TR1]
MLIRVNESDNYAEYKEYIELSEVYGGKILLELYIEEAETDNYIRVKEAFLDEESVDKLIKALQSFKKGGN